MGHGKLCRSEVCDYLSKKVYDFQRFFFAFWVKMQIFANVCGRPQPPSVSLWESLGAFLEVFGCLSGNLWKLVGASLGVFGCLWEPLKAIGSLWEPLGSFGNHWEPLGTALFVVSIWKAGPSPIRRLQQGFPRFLRLRDRKGCSRNFRVASITCCEHLKGWTLADSEAAERLSSFWGLSEEMDFCGES